jgi:glycine dehydrogenase subunit 1
MPYLYNTEEDQREMLDAIGAKSIDELFDTIPDDLKLGRALNLPSALSEMELDQHLRQLATGNQHAGQKVCFLGGGSYDHFVPSVCDVIGTRSEFYTSYTPYQAEASQGNLQAMFEYQSLIARLTGMAVANSSLYDGASAAAEAVLMALHAGGKRTKIVVPASLHPEYRQTITTYLENIDAQVDDNTAAVVLQQPNFFGCVEDADYVTDAARAAGALVIAAFDPISLGILKNPGGYGSGGGGASIAIAEGHTLGTPMSFGGPYLGIMACDQSLVRRIPGRIVGETKDRRGKRCFVLTLQTREQHIRREKATSNVCTNQALFAVRASVYLAQLGPQGLRETANLCLQKSRYLADQLCQNERFSLAFEAPTFKEFVIRDAENDVPGLLKTALDAGYLAGLPLGRWYPEFADCLLIAVTERRTKQELDGLAQTLATASRRKPALAK